MDGATCHPAHVGTGVIISWVFDAITERANKIPGKMSAIIYLKQAMVKGDGATCLLVWRPLRRVVGRSLPPSCRLRPARYSVFEGCKSRVAGGVARVFYE